MSKQKNYELGKWSLADLFPGIDSPDLNQTIMKLEELVADFEKQRESLNSELSTEEFMSLIKGIEDISYIIYKLYGFAGLTFYSDLGNQEAAAFQGKIQLLSAEIENRILFFSLWWKSLSDEEAAPLYESSGEYKYYLKALRNMKPFTLSEAEEKIVNVKNVTGPQAMKRLYETITSLFKYDLEVDGEQLENLSFDQMQAYYYHQDPDVRASVYEKLLQKYAEESPVLGLIYQNIIRDFSNENVDLRQFDSTIAVRNLINDVPDEIVDTLLAVAEKNAGTFQRYFRLKAKWLGVEKLRRYDIYAPIAKSNREYTYAEAVEYTLAAFEKFEPDNARLVRQVLDENHVDSELRPGKAGGAFCWGPVNDITPWVLLNFTGKARDISTIAHEMGHAIHNMLAGHNPLLTASSSLPLSETASTFSEMLLVDYLLEKETDQSVRRDLLFGQMDDAYATIMRQSFFAIFEKEAHSLIQSNASVSEISDAYLANIKRQFGDSLELSDSFKWEWVSIPHIYDRPFYVYAYAFGQLLVMALYQKYLTEGDSFKPKYLQILAAGGSAEPVEILAQAGIDITKATFWQHGFDRIDELLTSLEAIPVE